MNITVIFPKASCYDGKDLDTRRIYSTLIKRYLTLIKDAGCKVTCLLEDKLALDFLNEVGIKDYKVVTCLSKSDVDFFKNYDSLVDIPEYVRNQFSTTENCSGNVEQKYTVPISLVREDKNAYLTKRVEVYRKRLRVATDNYISSQTNVLMFRTENNLDRTTALRETVRQGDGRLCIEVNINSNMAVSYYGGVFIQEDYLPTILSM